jgi:hypothetical protein
VNDRPSSEDESPEITEVRRLLADARHTEPMPGDVTARMNRVIARLGDETPAAASEPSAGDVIPIAPHRRRRAATLLVAAAAIVVGGVAAGQLVHPSSSSDGAANAPASAQDFSSGDTANGGKVSGDQSFDNPGPHKTEVRHGRVLVRSKYFAYDALQGRRLLTTHQKEMAPDRVTVLQGCGRLDGRARVVPAEYQNAPAALLYRRPEGGSQIVNLYVCGSSRPIRTTTLPAP